MSVSSTPSGEGFRGTRVGGCGEQSHPVTDALAGLTTSGYDGQDVITQVSTPNGATTGFTVNGFGETRVETSPDRGTLTRSFDAAGSLGSETDARGITTGYGYDALNRLIAIDRPGTAEDVTYTWDAAPGCSFGWDPRQVLHVQVQVAGLVGLEGLAGGCGGLLTRRQH